ncbi:MAG: CDP-alcohol phosphatidyltransferase family protein [Candidatus Latescibacteria bacterium]|nr:CDP-alcohol phosphatidyltransferase family protein [Candidatus Latescibacterota bacterium]
MNRIGRLNWRVLIYPSTVIDYVRVMLLGAGVFCHFKGDAIGFVVLVTLSSVLDMSDGALARRLGHDSRFGEVFDFAIDIVTHTILWTLSGFPFAPVMIALEWGAGVSVLYLSVRQGDHWKNVLVQVPVKLMQYYFANRQRNVLATFAGVSHFGFRVGWYLGYGETWPTDIFVPGIILFEVVTAYMIWVAWRMRAAKQDAQT